MRARSHGLGVAFACAILLSPAVARAQNNTSGTAATIQVNAGWMNVDMDAGTNTQRWYKYPAFVGRSYCVEGISEATPVTPRSGSNDGQTDVLRGDGTTLIGSNDEQGDPGGTGVDILTPGRVCYIAPATEFNFAKVGNFSFAAIVKSFRWRVVETTLFCPWFFSGNGFEAFILIRNTTNQSVNVAVTLRSAAGAALASQSGIVPANGSFNLQVSDPAGLNLPTGSGNVEIAFGSSSAAGAPGGLIANLTSLNFGSGVSFDTPFGPRTDWAR